MKDECRERITRVVIRAGKIIRELKGLPEEKNITNLYNETSALLGVLPTSLTSRDAVHLPGLDEMKRVNGSAVRPLRKCPQCGKDTLELHSLCRACKDAEGGKYKTKWECGECRFKEKSEKFYAQWATEAGDEWRGGMKKDLGIKTVTDEGLK